MSEIALPAGTAFVDVEGRFDQLRKGIQREGDAAAQSLGRRISQGFDRIGSQLQSTGRRLTTRLTLPIVGLGVGILKVAGDFQSSMNQVRAVTGAAGAEFTQLEDLAKDLGRTTQFSASQAADAMYFLASAGFDTNEIMEALPGTLQLAAAAQMDLATAADLASNILSGFGLEATELGRVNDALVATFQNTNTNV
ncbi:MAG: phage tail tape measure protein, partial [Actinobacteria bacterium]|nr:phage tail tape measure protein [Actinomycetota bacterium]